VVEEKYLQLLISAQGRNNQHIAFYRTHKLHHASVLHYNSTFSKEDG